MNIKKLLICTLASAMLSLNGCSGVSSTWDWFFEDDEEQMVAEQQASETVEEVMEEEMTDEEMMEEEMMEEEMTDEEMTDEEMMDEEMTDEEMMDEAMTDDDYGDRPRSSKQGMPTANTSIYFDYKSKTVSASGLNILQAHAQYILSNPQVAVILIGHTDSVAPSDYNQRLSLKRAQSVAEAFVRMGVPESRIRLQGAGEGKPASAGDTDQSHALNRRVEIKYR